MRDCTPFPKMYWRVNEKPKFFMNEPAEPALQVQITRRERVPLEDIGTTDELNKHVDIDPEKVALLAASNKGKKLRIYTSSGAYDDDDYYNEHVVVAQLEWDVVEDDPDFNRKMRSYKQDKRRYDRMLQDHNEEVEAWKAWREEQNSAERQKKREKMEKLACDLGLKELETLVDKIKRKEETK